MVATYLNIGNPAPFLSLSFAMTSSHSLLLPHRARPSRSRHLAPSTQACVLIVLLQEAQVNPTTKTAQIRLSRSSPAYWRITFDNPPLNVMGPLFVQEFREIMTAIEDDEQVKVVVFDSAVEGFFLNHSDFLAKFEDLKRIPPGPTGLEAWPDVLVRLTRAPVVSIALIRGRATGNGSEIALACDMTFVSREKAVLSQWEVGIGLVAGGGPLARLPLLMGRGRALEVLLSSDGIGGELGQSYGYVNRALPDAAPDGV